jgi:dipeptidyl aminopeptidase/acylaminoacyl peptidase
MFRYGFLTGLILLAGQTAGAQEALGIFEGQGDVGKVLHPGAATYDEGTKTYTISGSGENMWFGKDEFYFVWKKISADELTFSATVAVVGSEGNAHRKGVLMVRQSLEGGSPYVDVARHAEGLTSLQYREKKGADTHEIEASVSGPAAVKIEKRGDRFYMWVGEQTGSLEFAGGSAWVEMRAPFYIGIGVCSHDKDAMAKFAFSDVQLDLKPKRPKKGGYSTIETVLLSGDARTALVSRKHLTAPGWTADGNALTYVDYTTHLQTPFTPLRTAAPVGAPVPVVTSDFSYFSSKSGETMQIWRKSADGSQSSQFTPDDFNNTSPHVSPDGKYLLFLSYSREYNKLSDDTPVMLRVMNLTDGGIKTLVSFVGGPESLGELPWSPDGKRIVFVSYQPMSVIRF